MCSFIHSLLFILSSLTSKGTPVEGSAAVGRCGGMFPQVAHGKHEGLVQRPSVSIK